MKRFLIILFILFLSVHYCFAATTLNVYTEEVEHPLQVAMPNKKLPKISKCGYMDSTNKVVIPAQYQLCSNFKNNQATVMIYGYDYYQDGAYNLYCINPMGKDIYKGACKGFSGLFYDDENSINQMQMVR